MAATQEAEQEAQERQAKPIYRWCTNTHSLNMFSESTLNSALDIKGGRDSTH